MENQGEHTEIMSQNWQNMSSLKRFPKGVRLTLNNMQGKSRPDAWRVRFDGIARNSVHCEIFFFLNRLSKVYWLCPSIGISRVASFEGFPQHELHGHRCGKHVTCAFMG